MTTQSRMYFLKFFESVSLERMNSNFPCKMGNNGTLRSIIYIAA